MLVPRALVNGLSLFTQVPRRAFSETRLRSGSLYLLCGKGFSIMNTVFFYALIYIVAAALTVTGVFMAVTALTS